MGQSNTAIADTALKLSTPRSISITGDGSYSVDFDGSANVSGGLVLANSGVSTGTYNNSATQVQPFTVDVKGRITGIGTPVDITPSWGAISGKPTTISGFGITDAQPLDTDLTAIAALAQSSKSVIFSNGSSWTAKQIDLSTDVTGILEVVNGGTSRTGFVKGQILFGNGTTNLGASSSFYWDNVNKYLGIGVGTPAYPLDVFGASRVSGQAQFTDIAESTSTTTGGVVFSGGIGVTKNIFYGGDLLGGTTGAWTPILDGETTSPAVTYTVQNGEYFRLGRLVIASFYITYSAISGGSGRVKISLPVASKSPIVSLLNISSISYCLDPIIQGTVPRITGENSSSCYLRSTVTAIDLLISELPASTAFVGGIIYLAS